MTSQKKPSKRIEFNLDSPAIRPQLKIQETVEAKFVISSMETIPIIGLWVRRELLESGIYGPGQWLTIKEAKSLKLRLDREIKSVQARPKYKE